MSFRPENDLRSMSLTTEVLSEMSPLYPQRLPFREFHTRWQRYHFEIRNSESGA
jgi:hypothetical protein